MTIHTRSITTIDCDYVTSQYAASYLLTDGPQALFVETNTTHAVPRLLEALRQKQMTPEQVEYIIVTHVHLDHAGGASALMRACPRAVLLAHPRAVPHLVDPAKLIAGARAVYGADAFERLYGRIEPIDESRVKALDDGAEIAFGSGAPLRFIHTRGHANHHFCIYEPQTRSIFTGDSFGLAYPALQQQGLFIFPSTSPKDFNGPLARQSIAKILASGAQQALLTHYGVVTALDAAAQQLLQQLDASEAILHDAVKSPHPESALASFCEEKLRRHFEATFTQRGFNITPAHWDLLRLDLTLNAQGLALVAAKRRQQESLGSKVE